MIDQSQLNALERNISQLMYALRDARAENDKLQQQIDTLDNKLTETARELDLMRENTRLNADTQKQNETFRKQRDALQKTLQRILRRVSALRSALED
jgi:predicted  nucleic acid-binding Zn-ribbon protein